jgi:hypothetical protein
MSIAGILSSSLFNYTTQNVQNKAQQFKQEFQQLGQDLQSGNLSAAQADFATLEQSGPLGATSSSSAPGSSAIGQEFSQLGQDLQSGNLSAAQQDYTNIQQNFQNQAAQGSHRHHHGGGGGGGGANAINQILEQLGQDLQSGNVSAAQQAYTSLQQDFQQLASNGPWAQPASLASPGTTSVSA